MGKFKTKWKWGMVLWSMSMLMAPLSSSFAVNDQKSEVEPGYSSSYLPTKQGQLVKQEWKSDDHGSLELDDSNMSVAERFDKSRKGTLGADFELKGFYEAVGYNPKAEGWEGKCHQWSAGASDKNIKPLINQSKGILCQGLAGKAIVLEEMDLKELITATYPSSTKSLFGPGSEPAFFGGRNAKNPSQKDDINDSDYAMMDSLGGESDFPPQEFHEKIHQYLKDGQGVVLDVDPREQVWNQPTYSADSKVETPAELPMLPAEVYQAPSKEAQDKLASMEEINNVFRVLLEKTDKTSDNKVSELVAADPSMAGSISPALMDQVKKLEASGNGLSFVVDELMRLKDSTFQEAIAAGLALKPGLNLKRVDTDVTYLVETYFRGEGRPTRTQTFSYYIVEDDKGKAVTSQWIGPNANHMRPDFMWVPNCSSETCHKDADRYRSVFKTLSTSQQASYEKVGLTIGLSDLLKLFKECFPLDKAIEVAGRFVGNVNSIKSLWELSDDQKKEIADDFKIIKDSKIPVKMDSIKKIMTMPGLSIDAQNNLTLTDWDPKTLDCMEYKDGKSAKVPKLKCMGNPTDGKFEKWGLFEKECWESSGPFFFKKWHRRVPMALCEAPATT